MQTHKVSVSYTITPTMVVTHSTEFLVENEEQAAEAGTQFQRRVMAFTRAWDEESSSGE